MSVSLVLPKELLGLPTEVLCSLFEAVDAHRLRGVCKQLEALLAGVRLKSRYSVDARKFWLSYMPYKGAALVRELEAHLRRFQVTDVYACGVHAHVCLDQLGGVLARNGEHLQGLHLERTAVRLPFLRLAELSRLTFLNVSRNRDIELFSEDMVNLALPPGLRKLIMSSSGVRARALGGLCRAARGCPGLTALDLSFNELRGLDVAGTLAAFTALEEVSVANANLTPAQLALVVKAGLSSKLRTLDVSHNDVANRSDDDEAFYSEAQLAEQAVEAEKMLAGLGRFECLTHLRLAGLFVGEQADVLGRALLSLPALEALDLAETGLGPWSAHVAQALPALTALVALNVSSCGVDTALGATRFGDGLAASTALRRLRAGDNGSDFHVPAIAALEARGVRVERRSYP